MTKDSKDLASAASEFLLYAAPDGAVKVRVLFKEETAWLTQKALAELFGVKVPAINKHLKNIFESGELDRSATVSKMEIVQSEGAREAKIKAESEYEVYRQRQDAEYLSDFDRVVQEAKRLEGKQEPKALGPGKGGDTDA